MRAQDLDYDLPDELIAQEPLPKRDGGRLLVVSRQNQRFEHSTVAELGRHMPPRSLLVVNDTAVIPARLLLTKPTGGRLEVLLVERLTPAGSVERWSAMVRGGKTVKPGSTASVADLEIRFLERAADLWVIEVSCSRGVADGLNDVGRVPLPPYIRRSPEATDRERYQTVFARYPGAVAAPTAGLHLSLPLLESLQSQGHDLAKVTLHVGPGTFAPLRSDVLAEHVMHSERYNVSSAARDAIVEARLERRSVVAVGTTVVRTLESAYHREIGCIRSGDGRSSLFIYPPYTFTVVDALLTNFHLPRSTLLALVAAFGGVNLVRSAYAAAVKERYRFFSYGDAMLIV